MKILINTLSNTEIAEIRAQQEKDGVKPADLFTGTYLVKGEWFQPGAWVHVADDFDVSAYPAIKEASVVFEEKLKLAVEEAGLSSFAQGIKEQRVSEAKPIELIVADVLKYVPPKIAAVGVVKELEK
jgi:hypothetical protein